MSFSCAKMSIQFSAFRRDINPGRVMAYSFISGTYKEDSNGPQLGIFYSRSSLSVGLAPLDLSR